jgi:hypothetical protein
MSRNVKLSAVIQGGYSAIFTRTLQITIQRNLIMKKTIPVLLCLLASPLVFAGVKVQVMLPALESAEIEKMAPNSEEHAYSYAQTNLKLVSDFKITGRLDLVDLKTPKNNAGQDMLRHFTVLVTGKSKIDKLDSALSSCLAGGEQMKKAKGANKVIITAEADEIITGMFGGVAIMGEGTEGDKRSVVKIDPPDQYGKFASITFLNPKSLNCQFVSAGAAVPKL